MGILRFASHEPQEARAIKRPAERAVAKERFATVILSN
jgi:hypothetical protein